ncbi:NAD-dependent succinate-semialdehyde dehydrogenase [Microbacterium sp.]|uniref:NAD-dependent succinate-semialdehyde dehydrogenase n=1 Tax=Microbacterium sp. TaxID=51671 RepID=UPI003A912831
MYCTVDPRTGTEVARFPFASAIDVDTALAGAARAQRSWRQTSAVERRALLRALAGAVRDRADECAALITLEMGKPAGEAQAEIAKCAATLDYYAEYAERLLADEPVETEARTSVVVYEPLGIVLAIMPWNYPFWQFFRFLAPALAAGNGAVLKHAANVPLCTNAIAEIVRDAGAPEGLVATLFLATADVAGVIGDDRIAAVTLTGSTRAGAAVAAQAGAALKRQVLELGGSDPFLVLADADVAAAASAAVAARFTNGGQSCVNAKRFVVVESVADRFVEAFAAELATWPVGDPTDAATRIGPMARDDLRAAILDQTQRTIAAGARLVTGGSAEPGPGWYTAPTILDNVPEDAAAFREETFGPLAAVARVADDEAAVHLANDTEYGLGASIWTQDLDRARDLAGRIDAGAVFVNSIVASDPRLPFGGVKQSGYGRELGTHGIREFVNIKTISIR